MSDPFESEEAREAYREALDYAFEASRHLTNFLHVALKGEPVTPAATLKATVDALKEAEAAWIKFGRLSEPEKDWEQVTLQ